MLEAGGGAFVLFCVEIRSWGVGNEKKKSISSSKGGRAGGSGA